MNKKRVALALAAALGINTLMVTVGQVGQQAVVAHAQNARLTGEQVKLLEGVKIKSLATEVEISSTGEPALTFTDIKKENIKNVRVTESFKHEVFTERKDIDTQVNTGINGTWDSSTGKLKLSSKIVQPGIYTGKVEIELTDGTKEAYTISLRKTPSDSVSFIADVKVGTIEISNLVLNNGAGDVSNFTPKKVSVLLNGGTEKEVTAASGKYVVSALDLTINGKLKEGDVLTVKIVYGSGSEYTLSEEVAFVGAEKKEVLNAFASNDTTEFAKLANQIDTDFGVTGASTGSLAGGTNTYDVTVGGKTLFTYDQTTVSNTTARVGGAKLLPSISGDVVNLTLSTVSLYSTTATDNFVPYVGITYGNAGATTGIIGNYSIQAEGQQANIYFDAITTDPTLGTAANTEYVKYDPAAPTQLQNNLGSYSVDINFDKIGHGYSPIGISFSVDASEDTSKIDTINKKIDSGSAQNKRLASYAEAGSTVLATLVVSTDILDGAHAQAKFEQTSASEGKITLVGGRKIVGTSTDLNNVRLTVGGATSVSVIGSESTKDDLVFSVQFDGQVPTTIDWSLGVNNTNKVKGTLETGVLESTNIKSVKATNSGTQNIKDQFSIEADFNLSFPNNSTTKVTVDDSTSDRVTLDQFKTGEHTVNVKAETGKYQGTYKAGVMVTQQPFVIEVKDAKSVSNTSASLVIDANFFNTTDIAKVPGGVVQYSEKTVNGNTTTWSDWKDSSTKVDKADVKEDAITKTVTGLTGGRTYKFRVVYDYSNGTTTEKVYSSETGEVTLPTSSSSSTITGSGGTTTGTSTGSTTITVTTSNSTLTGTSASVTLPSGFRYDSGKNPVAVTFKYKDKDGKIVTETKEQYSNVTAKFNGNNVELNGLVPGKDYNEITVDYTDNNGKTRSIILKNVKTTSQTQVETYLANVYEVVFGRPADEAGYHFHLDNLKNKKVSLRDFLLNMLNEKEFVEKYKSTEEKIEALYNAIVNRTSDEAGKKFWVDEYKKVLAVYGSETTALKAIADRMVNENELKELADKMGVQW